MRKLFRFFISTALCFIVTVSLSPACRAQIVINEILADPATDWDGDGNVNLRDDEWIEVANIGDTPIDLSAYLVADGEEGPVWRYGFAGLLGPGEVRVVFGSESKAWEQANGFPVYSLSLNNGGDRLVLFRIIGTDTVLVDEYTYADQAAEDDRSVGREAGTVGTWSIFDALNPCPASCDPPGNGCVPTPGSTNECITSARTESWSRIKTIYR
jgi:hypothetical protein